MFEHSGWRNKIYYRSANLLSSAIESETSQQNQQTILICSFQFLIYEYLLSVMIYHNTCKFCYLCVIFIAIVNFFFPLLLTKSQQRKIREIKKLMY